MNLICHWCESFVGRNTRLTLSDHVNCSLILALWHNNYLRQFPHAYFWPRGNTPSCTTFPSHLHLWNYPDNEVYNYENTRGNPFYTAIVWVKSKLNTVETREKGKRIEEHEEARTGRFNASNVVFVWYRRQPRKRIRLEGNRLLQKPTHVNRPRKDVDIQRISTREEMSFRSGQRIQVGPSQARSDNHRREFNERVWSDNNIERSFIIRHK